MLVYIAECSRPVWIPSSVEGKPFPTRQLGIEVWGVGAFKFKGIAGHSKVCLLYPTHHAPIHHPSIHPSIKLLQTS